MSLRQACDVSGLSSVSISVCLLVQDELPFLEPWAASVRRWADQVIIMDTGSTDGTREWILNKCSLPNKIVISEKLGTIEDRGFVWCRNQLSDSAAGEWIYHLDADEAVPDEQIPQITKCLMEAQAPALTVITCNFDVIPDVDPSDWETISTTAKCTTEFPHRRIFRRDKGFRFRGYIHEELFLGNTNAVEYAQPSGLFHNHFSKYRDPERKRAKRQLYAKMLLRAEQDPVLQKEMNPGWLDMFLPSRREEIEELARG